MELRGIYAGAAGRGSMKLHIDFRSGDEERKRHCGNCGNREVDGVESHCKLDGSRIGYCDMEFRWCRRWRRNRKFDNMLEPPEEE